MTECEKYLASIREIPDAVFADLLIVRQIIEGAEYVRQCADNGEQVDPMVAYPWPMAFYTAEGRAAHGLPR